VKQFTKAFRLFFILCWIEPLFSSESSLLLRARVPLVESTMIEFSQNKLIIARRTNQKVFIDHSNLKIEISDGLDYTKSQTMLSRDQLATIDVELSPTDTVKISFTQQ
jgi:hypothetical protein